MDNQNVRPEPKEVAKASPEGAKNTSPSKNLHKRHPWLLFMVLFGMSLGVGIFGYYQLIYIGYVPQIQTSKPAAAVSQETNTTSSNLNNPTPLWLMLAIALSCASGCWVIYRLLKLPQRI
ncbi:hypothetical protein [Anabaena azotica]|uniref:hypothetical protein n=1 Tax=Anabaena azotica TaxID=197653 RepID=UPI0039A68A4A